MDIFYIKDVGDDYALYHRPTHSFLGSFTTEKALFDAIKLFTKMDRKVFWETLIKLGVTMPSDSVTYEPSNREKEAEEWYLKAWKIVTESLYKKHKKVMPTEEIPFALLKEIRREKARIVHEEGKKSFEGYSESRKYVPKPKRVKYVPPPKPVPVVRVQRPKDQPGAVPTNLSSILSKF